jgi:ribosomal 30S subunit maturation factor RimM
MAEPLVPLGEIVATHGLDGWLRLNPLNPKSKTLSPGLSVHLQKSGEVGERRLKSASGTKTSC